MDGPAEVRVFPPASGRETEIPLQERVPMPIFDCRPIADQLSLDQAGFELLSHRTAFRDFYVDGLDSPCEDFSFGLLFSVVLFSASADFLYSALR